VKELSAQSAIDEARRSAPRSISAPSASVAPRRGRGRERAGLAWRRAAGLVWLAIACEAALGQVAPQGAPNPAPAWRSPSAPARPGVNLRFARQVPPAPGGAALGSNVENVPTPPPVVGQSNDLIDPEQAALNSLGATQLPLGATPTPSAQTLQRFNQYVERTIDPQVTFDLIQGRPRLIMLKQAPARVQMGDDNVASYTLVTDREISVTGVSIGSTVLNFWFQDPAAEGGFRILSYLVRVLPDPESKKRLELIYKALEGEINKNFPNSWVQLSLVGDKLVVRGEAKDIVEAAQILQVVGANAPGQRQAQQQQQAGGRGGQGFNLQNVPFDVSNQNQNMWGTPEDFVNAQQYGAATSVSNQVIRVNSNVINLLRVPGEQQVMLRVTVAEVDRNAARSIGMNMNMFTNTANAMTSVAGGAVSASNMFPYIFQQTAGSIGTGNLPVLLDNGQISLAINALRSLSLARSLAEPNLVTTNGQPAMFHAGGSFPIASGGLSFGAAYTTVQYLPLGVQLFFTPSITDHDRVRLQVRAAISTASSASTDVNGNSVPSNIDQRTFFTTVELREGQTLAIAGLLQNNYGATSMRIPLWGDLPLIGIIGGTRSSTSLEQELVVLVTPELVHPLEACRTPNVPGSDIFEPGDVEFYLFGRLESIRNYDFRAGTRTDWDRMRVYERCEDQLIIGPQGRTYGCCGGYGGPGGRCPGGCPPVADAAAGRPTPAPNPVAPGPSPPIAPSPAEPLPPVSPSPNGPTEPKLAPATSRANNSALNQILSR